MKKQYTNPVITIEELLKQDVLLSSDPTIPTSTEKPIGIDGPPENIDLG